MFDARFVSGQQMLSYYQFEWYRRYREGDPSFWDSGDLGVTVDEIDGPFSVPLGEFTDVVRVEIQIDQSQGVSFDRFRWWLARDVGIVQFDLGARRGALVWGVINGRPVFPR